MQSLETRALLPADETATAELGSRSLMAVGGILT
jgi:hypothetical protein